MPVVRFSDADFCEGSFRSSSSSRSRIGDFLRVPWDRRGSKLGRSRPPSGILKKTSPLEVEPDYFDVEDGGQASEWTNYPCPTVDYGNVSLRAVRVEKLSVVLARPAGKEGVVRSPDRDRYRRRMLKPSRENAAAVFKQDVTELHVSDKGARHPGAEYVEASRRRQSLLQGGSHEPLSSHDGHDIPTPGTNGNDSRDGFDKRQSGTKEHSEEHDQHDVSLDGTESVKSVINEHRSSQEESLMPTERAEKSTTSPPVDIDRLESLSTSRKMYAPAPDSVDSLGGERSSFPRDEEESEKSQISNENVDPFIDCIADYDVNDDVDDDEQEDASWVTEQQNDQDLNGEEDEERDEHDKEDVQVETGVVKSDTAPEEHTEESQPVNHCPEEAPSPPCQENEEDEDNADGMNGDRNKTEPCATADGVEEDRMGKPSHSRLDQPTEREEVAEEVAAPGESGPDQVTPSDQHVEATGQEHSTKVESVAEDVSVMPDMHETEDPSQTVGAKNAARRPLQIPTIVIEASVQCNDEDFPKDDEQEGTLSNNLLSPGWSSRPSWRVSSFLTVRNTPVRMERHSSEEEDLPDAMPGATRDEDGVEDMIQLSVLTEQSILKNLQARYGRDKIYTYTGSILVAVNPYKMFNIYGLDMVKRYEGHPLGDLAPHLFAVGSASYGKMMKDTENQVIVISGESGAGKTESTKLVMQYLAAVNKSGNNLITEQILEANPLLESFGNSRTIRNDNSSRFGKYIEVFFKSGSIVGAKTSEYLLEKSRIVTQAPGERNYHVFYEMLAAMTPEQKGKFGLQDASRYFYLNQGGEHQALPGRDDAENYRKLTGAMDILSFQRKEQDTIVRILASVLHIGNVYFNAKHVDNHDTVELGSDAELKWISYLLQLSEDWLKQALTSKVTEARGDRVISPYNLDQALDARDAIAKALYSRLFSWLVERINHIVCRAERERTTSLALLDIFGFEDFLVNSFEQLCINYANETLQFFFNQHIFRLEQKEYSKEKIHWQHIDFRDNQATLDLIASKPAGVLHILDDESNFPQSTDHSFLEKCHFHHTHNVLYEKPRMSDPHFCITHYAGKIKYNVSHFLEKNKDTLRSDVVELLCESKNEMISQMFNEMRDRHITKTLSKTTGRYVTLKPRTLTVAANFNESLLSLIDTMSRCNPFFIRCIKPNAEKAPMQFDESVVLEQLRYTGMLETIRIRKMGYPIRIKFPTFIERYRCLAHGRISNQMLPSDACAHILETQGPTFAIQYQIGATKVFMKETFEQHLDEAAAQIQRDAAIRIQKSTRAFLARKHFLRIQKSTLQVQKMLRMWIARKRYLLVRRGVIRAQAQYRMQRQLRRYKQVREDIRRKLEEERQARKQQEAKERMEKEQRERAARAAASVANLEIPGQLAYIYNKLEDWHPMHGSQHILTAVGDVLPMDMEYQLPPDVNAHAFSKYTSVYFKNPSWGVQLTPLKAALTPVQGQDTGHHALSVFQLILRFMMDQNMMEKKEKTLSDYIVQMGLQHEGLRDEILCQLVNQTWQNQNLGGLERAWLLMAMCLSCFPPSATLFKYLLKYVSDVGLDGYKITCQHKALQCASIEAQLCRVYPPCFLEWRAAKTKANMALEVKFPDNCTLFGHVESWTSGELFTSHLLRVKGLSENCHGWTVALVEDADCYELMGYDYVLDLISEMELPPGFPTRSAYFLVSSDRSQERIPSRRRHHVDSPHNAEKERIMVMEGQMPEMIQRHSGHAAATVSTTTTTEHGRFSSSEQRRTSHLATMLNGHTDNLALSMTSKLNERPTDINSSNLANNRLNARYRKRQAPAPPTANGHINGFANGAIHPIPEDEAEMDLSQSRLNRRYANGEVVPKEELSGSKLNSRYKKPSRRGGGGGAGGAREQIERGKVPTDARSVISDQSDWSHWVEDVFNLALNDHDDLSDAKSLENRIKGGGKGVPGIQTQQTTVPMSLPLGVGMLPPLQQPVLNSVPITNASFSTPITMQQDPVLMAQQLAQQQAALQGYLSQLQQQQQQQPQQQMALQAALLQQQQQTQQAAMQAALQQQQQQQQQSQQQTAALRAALQQQELQNMLLKQSIEQQMLRQQLQQLQTTQPLSPMSPSSSYNSGMNLPPELAAAAAAQVGLASTAGAVQGAGVEQSGPKKVKYIKSSFENQQTSTTFSQQSQPVFQLRQPLSSSSSSGAAGVAMATSSATHGKAPPPPPLAKPVIHQPPVAPIPPPMLPPTEEVISPRLHSQPAEPPAPPPPLPEDGPFEDMDEEEEGGTYTFTDTKGRARTVRIGRVVWPPPKGKEGKRKREVGKLEIDENVAQNLRDKITAKGKWQKPTSEKEGQQRPKSILKKGDEAVTTRSGVDKTKGMQRTKSLVESSEHMQTLKLLEMKLGGKGTPKEDATPSEPTPPVQPAPLASSVPPPPPPPVVNAGNVYSTRIDPDVAPPLPNRPPPKLKTEMIQTEEIEDTIYMTRIVPDRPVQSEEAIYQSRIESETSQEESKLKIDYSALERVITELFPQNKHAFLMYNHVPWELRIRKEVFWPTDKLENSMALHLIFCQIIQDVYNNGCIRIGKEERIKMRGMLEGYGINKGNYLTQEFRTQVKKIVVDTAKEWPTYFCRLFPVAAKGQHSSVHYLGVSHTGLRLVCRERSLVDDHLVVLEEIRFEDVVDVVMPTNATIQLNLKSKSIMFYSPRARQMKDMIDRFCTESERGNKYVVATKDYLTRESTLLSFRRGDIIKLMDPEMHLDDGWLYGCLNGVVGLFPAEYIKALARHEVEVTAVKPQLVRQVSRDTHVADNQSETSQGTVVADGKYSMIEFAMMFYRESLEKQTTHGVQVAGSGDWSWKEQADLVKWTRSPVQASLLKLTSSELNKLALECFIAIMQFMGDYPMSHNQTDFDCVLKVLRCCHKYPDLRDEIFCQLCKQTTNNRSMKPKSAIRGWRLFALTAAYCDCSDQLRPYLFKYLETTAADTSRTYSNAAALCLQNLRKTLKYGGRKNVPLREEVQALADGRNCKRFPYVYSGSDEQGGMLQVRSCTIVLDCIEEICRVLHIVDPVEMEEYTLFIRSRDGGFYKLSRDDYILDVTAEYVRKKMDYDLMFQRMVWYFPMIHLDNEVYVDMMFQQSIPDYLDGLLVMMQGGRLSQADEDDIVTLGALLHKLQDSQNIPTMKQLGGILPRMVLNSSLATPKPQQWLNRIHQRLQDLRMRSPLACQAEFLEILSRWQLFGSTFFLIKSIPNFTGACMLAINKSGIFFLRNDTHEIISHHPFSEILSTRRYRSDSNVNFLDMKIGNLMVQRITRIETDQGSDISNLIGQYMNVINRDRKRQDRAGSPQ